MAELTELDVLGIVSERLTALGCRYMLTGSFALAYYATPRMTRDLDFVVELDQAHIAPLITAFHDDFYVDEDAARSAVSTARMFNLMHLASGIKVDVIVRKDQPYRRIEFDRRVAVRLGAVPTWIASREDLILSKLVWGHETGSEMQRRDVAALLRGPVDREYLALWAAELGVAEVLRELGT